MRPIMITVPADEPELRDKIIEQLERYAEVSEPPPAMDLNIPLIIEIIRDVVEFSSNAAGVAAFLLLLKEEYGKKVRINRLGDSAPPRRLDDTSDEEIREMSGASEE